MSNGFLSKFMQPFQNTDYLSDELIFEGDSTYHHIMIKDEGPCRTMYFGAFGEEAETSINLANANAAVFEYPGMMLAALALGPKGKNIAMIGLGGGYIPELFKQHLPQFDLTVVEIDRLVAELAQTYFGFLPGKNVKLIIGDGRDFIEKQEENSLDQIWLDAFSGDYVPPQLSGLEFLRICEKRLKTGGLLVQNLHQSRPNIFNDQLKTTEAAFDHFLALEGLHCGNVIVISKKNKEITEWTKSYLEKSAKNFGRRIGPYDLVNEMKKVKNIRPSKFAKIIE